jgi:hypothetical protein
MMELEEETWICCKCNTTNYEDTTCSECDHDRCDNCQEGD